MNPDFPAQNTGTMIQFGDVDIVDLLAITEEFRAHIQPTMIPLL